MNILIVDDDARHSQSVSDVLAAHNYPNTTIANLGAEGLQILRERSSEFAVLLLDLHIPDLSGVEILQAIKEAQIPVKTIVLSGEQDLDTVTPILQLGAFHYIRKPFEAQELVTAVSNALGQHALEQEVEQMHREAKADADLYGFLLNASPDMVYMLDQEGHFKYLNHQLGGVFDVDTEHLVRAPWQALFDGHEHLEQSLAHQFNERRTGIRATVAEEFEYETNVGTRHNLELSSIGLYEHPAPEERKFVGTYGVVRDITESRRTRRQLAQSQRKFQSLFAESPDAVFIARLDDGLILERNTNFAHVRASITETDDDTDAFIWTPQFTRATFIQGLSRTPNHFDWTFEKQVSGHTRYFELRARQLELEGDVCMLATLRDRTAERLAEQDRLALEQQLQQAGRMEAIGQVAGGIAHDFNNILASIIGYAELIMTARARLEEAQVNEYLGEVVTAGHRARDLISQMLTFTKAQKGESAAVDVSETISDVSRMLDAAIPSTIEVTTQFAANLPKVWVDPVQIQQIIINLLINARDAIEGTGSIHVDVFATEDGFDCQTCSERASGEHVIIQVSDTGHGIAPEILERIFEMYFTTRAPDQGTGFGLWMINSLVHQHAGHITVQTKVGSGTTFRIHLPRYDEHEHTTEKPMVPVPQIKGRVVVVDDEVSVANFIGELLRDKGYPTVVFHESPQALEYLTTNLDKTALLLTDGTMPLMSGIELVERCRSLRADLPVIFITAYAQDLDLKAIQRLKVNTFLRKPFSIDEMLEAVGKLVQVAETDQL